MGRKKLKRLNRKEGYLTSTQVCQRLDISSRTLDSWYKFYRGDFEHPENMPKLPEYTQETSRGPRYWVEEDVKALRQFRDWVPRGRGGVMGRLNEQYWSPEHRLDNRMKKEAEKAKAESATETNE